MRTNRRGPTVTDLIESIKEQVCDQLCKWPERYGVEGRDVKDPERYDQMLDEVCEHCPLDRL